MKTKKQSLAFMAVSFNNEIEIEFKLVETAAARQGTKVGIGSRGEEMGRLAKKVMADRPAVFERMKQVLG